jgi:hypothetical protein
MKIRPALIAAYIVAGCAPAAPVEPIAPKPVPVYDSANPGPWCAEVAEIISNPYATPGQQEQARVLLWNRCK